MKDKTNKHQNQHPDDMAVDRFAAAMKIKLAAAREKGRSGWDDPAACQVDHLAELLVSHVGKGNHGNFEDIANLAMMLHQRGADPSVLSDGIQQSGKSNWPDKCPITRRDFFMEIDGVPTYGGPYDSYTIPEMEGTPDQPWHERELTVRRYDHDRGSWWDYESIPLRIINENVLWELEEKAEGNSVSPEWTDAQCLEFLSVAFRHCEIKGDVVFDEIRQGVSFALAAAKKIAG